MNPPNSHSSNAPATTIAVISFAYFVIAVITLNLLNPAYGIYVCFLFAFLTIWSSDAYVKYPPPGTPTPVIPSATASQAIPTTTSIP
jgi:hypothetical protein